ncbi:hypothetical protein ABT294_48695 [Nonomuraea sp. NPDC000554]|uniref:hypothetical protein n=1 Tax=Nonomuraea sp. NPDC000554 TaxID=3154259 RepID=UPI00332D96FD
MAAWLDGPPSIVPIRAWRPEDDFGPVPDPAFSGWWRGPEEFPNVSELHDMSQILESVEREPAAGRALEISVRRLSGDQ